MKHHIKSCKAVALLLCLILCSAAALPAYASGETDTSLSQSSLPPQSAADSDTSDAAGGADTGEDVQPHPDAAAGEEASLYIPGQFSVQAEAAYLVNEDSGVVVYQKNAHTPLPAASLVKMMTCIIIMDRVQDIDAETVLAETWVFNELSGKNASHADIWKGESLTVRELLYAMLLPSANEAALMAASYVAGGYMPNFLYMMNTYAERLGCTNTSFADPNGLSEQSVSTAHDMYLITRKFMSYPLLVEIASTAVYQMAAHNHSAPYNILTTNRLLVASDSYAKAYPKAAASVVAGKTGSLGEWQNFCSMAQQNDMTWYCVVLHSPNSADGVAAQNEEATRWRPALYEAAMLYDWALGGFTVQPTLDTTKPITEVAVRYSTAQDSVRLMPASDLKTILPVGAGQETTLSFDVPEFVAAPVAAGQALGSVTVSLRGQKLGTVELVAQSDVDRNQFKYILQRLEEFFAQKLVKGILIVAGVLVAGYLALLSLAGWRHRRRQAAKQAAQPPPKPRPPGGQSGEPRRRPPPGG